MWGEKTISITSIESWRYIQHTGGGSVRLDLRRPRGICRGGSRDGDDEERLSVAMSWRGQQRRRAAGIAIAIAIAVFVFVFVVVVVRAPPLFLCHCFADYGS
jgi:hypothetical protein